MRELHQKKNTRIAILSVCFITVSLSACLLEAQPAVAKGPGYDPSDFRVTTFAENLHFPTSMLQLPDKSLLVGSSATGGNFFSSPGELLRFVDQNKDGVADGPPKVLYTGLPPAITSVRRAEELIFVTSSASGSERISFLRAGARPVNAFSLIGSIRFVFPTPWNHTTYALAVRNTPGKMKSYDLFFNVGSRENFSRTTDKVHIKGLIRGTLRGDSIYMVTVQDLGTSVIVTGLTQVASGLRNAAGIAFHSGDLYFEDNGINQPEDESEPLSADEVNRIKAADIGGAVENFGFPDDYIQYRTGIRQGSGGIQPLIAFQPIPNPFTGSESEGAVEIAFVPQRFPDSLITGIFIGFHGEGGKAGRANGENPVLHYHLREKTYFQFISNKEPKVGHLDWLLATSDSLFLADLSTAGTFHLDDTGAIYQIKYIPRSQK